VQTPDGYVWLMTEAGLARFDGVHFTRFTRFRNVPGAIGSGLCVASDGTLWVGLEERGVVNLRGESPAYYAPGNGLVTGSVRTILRARDGAIWVANGASRFQNGRWQGWPIPEVAASRDTIAEDRNGTIAIATTEGLYLKRAADREFSRDPALSASIFRVSTDPDGSLWVMGPSNFGPVPEGVPGKEHSANFGFFKDRTEGVWFSNSFDRGAHLARSPRELLAMSGAEHLGVEEGLSGYLVRTYFEDVEGNIWIGTNNGLDRLSPSSFQAVPLPQFQAGTVKMMLLVARDGSLLMAPLVGNTLYKNGLGKTQLVSVGSPWIAGSLIRSTGGLFLQRRLHAE